jgi:hypothetical protein
LEIIRASVLLFFPKTLEDQYEFIGCYPTSDPAFPEMMNRTSLSWRNSPCPGYLIHPPLFRGQGGAAPRE